MISEATACRTLWNESATCRLCSLACGVLEESIIDLLSCVKDKTVSSFHRKKDRTEKSAEGRTFRSS